LVAHELRLLGLTIADAAAISGACTSYILIVGRLSPDQRAAVRRGELTLATLTNGKPSKAAVKRYVSKVGPNTILDVLDEMTAPEPAAAVNGHDNGGPVHEQT
jgi:hypothetical protein